MIDFKSLTSTFRFRSTHVLVRNSNGILGVYGKTLCEEISSSHTIAQSKRYLDYFTWSRISISYLSIKTRHQSQIVCLSTKKKCSRPFTLI